MAKTATTCLLIYSTAGRICRRLHIPDTDAEIATPAELLQPGESSVSFSLTQLQNFVSLTNSLGHELHRHALAYHLNVDISQIPTGRCAVVDGNGNVVGVMMADPALDSVPGYTLIASDVAGNGWIWNGTAFVAPVIGMLKEAQADNALSAQATVS